MTEWLNLNTRQLKDCGLKPWYDYEYDYVRSQQQSSPLSLDTAYTVTVTVLHLQGDLQCLILSGSAENKRFMC